MLNAMVAVEKTIDLYLPMSPERSILVFMNASVAPVSYKFLKIKLLN